MHVVVNLQSTQRAGNFLIHCATNDLLTDILLHGIVTNLSSTQAIELFLHSLIYNVANYMSFWGQSNTYTTSYRIIKFCVVIDLKEIYKFWAFQLHTEQQTILNLCYWVCLSHTGILYINLPENREMWFECQWVWCTTVWGMLVCCTSIFSSAHRHYTALHYPTGQHSPCYIIKQIPFRMKIRIYVMAAKNRHKCP